MNAIYDIAMGRDPRPACHPDMDLQPLTWRIFVDCYKAECDAQNAALRALVDLARAGNQEAIAALKRLFPAGK
jgi:hypothetical protein